MDAYLALDAGTTSSRALVFAQDGRLLGSAQHEFEQHYPQSGYVEHDAEEIWRTQWRAAQEAVTAAGSPRVLGIGIANQRETVVLFERATGKPLHRAIVWQDRRTADGLARLARRELADRVREQTGLPLDPYFSAAKIAWLLDAVPGAREAAERGELCAGTIDTWLLYRLTGGQVVATEPSNASRTSLFDTEAGDWSDELLEFFGVPRAVLPSIQDSMGRFGVVAVDGCAFDGAPITGMLGDQQAALFGQDCLEVGDAKCTYGTGAFLLAQCGTTRPQPPAGVLATVAWRVDGKLHYALEGSVMICGALVQWLRDGLHMIDSSASIEALARTVADSDGVVVVPALAGLGTPHWDPTARGAIFGLHRGTTQGHIARAAIEAMALSVRDVQAAMVDAGVSLARLRVDGGAAANDLLLELQATLGQLPVERSAHLETTAIGAARAAMRGGGVHPPFDIGGACTTFEPGVTVDRGLLRRWDAGIQRSRGWTAI